MKSNAQKLRDAAAMIIGADEANLLLQGAQDDAVKAFKQGTTSQMLTNAGESAIRAMQNMRQGRFQGAAEGLRIALREYNKADSTYQPENQSL